MADITGEAFCKEHSKTNIREEAVPISLDDHRAIDSDHELKTNLQPWLGTK